MENNLQKGSTVIIVSIVVAITIVALAIIFTGGNEGSVAKGGGNRNIEAPDTKTIKGLRLPSTDSHIRGDINAPVTIIEFSDFECPFCSRIHPTLAKLTDDFPEKVSWEFRHFPLSSIHSRARTAAIASECVAKLGGNGSFWEFTDTLFSNQRSLGNDLYEKTVADLGINVDEFNTCLEDKRIATEVDTDLREATSSGGRGTPFSIAVSKDGQMIPFSGALPYEQILSLVDSLIN
jgi:protein-disulfide isomerase